LLAVAIGAEELVLLTDVDRLYSSDPRTDAEAVPIAEVSDPQDLERLQKVAGGGGQWGTGGMTTKLTAARIATSSGIRVRLADGRDPAVLEALLAGEAVGTVFQPSTTPLTDRKGWLAHAMVPSGTLVVDAGAEQALRHQGASLLAVGIKAVEGRFDRCASVRVVSLDGREIGRGLCRLNSDEVRGILGLGREEIRRKLGEDGGAIVHRDHMVVVARG